MTQALVYRLPELSQSASSGAAGATLCTLRIGETGRVLELALDAEMAEWLRAVGISEEEEVTVLRCAAFGGPIHVRTSSGGEFALHRTLAASVRTRRVRGQEPRP